MRAKKNVSIAGASFVVLIGLLCQVSTQTPASSITQPATIQAANSSAKANIVQPVVATKTETTQVMIPYTSSTVQDSTISIGQTSVRTTGINGIRTDTYTVTTTDDKETARVLSSSDVTTPVVNEVIANGTYVARAPVATPSLSTYTNSDGNTIPSPSTTGGTQGGYSPTALCRDGTYSYSQHRSGTCSYHGGVSSWL